MKNKKKNEGRWNSTTVAKGDSKSDMFSMRGEVIESLPNTMFKVKVEGGQELLCMLGGKLRMNRIRVLLGDRVEVEISPYDLTRGRVIWRQ